MKILDRYVVFSILRISLATLFICTLLVLAVELFSSMNNYVTNALPFSDILWLSFLGIPEYLMMCVSLSFLFGTTFFFSQLESNNEMIMILNAGISYRRLCLPVIIMTSIVTAFFFIFSQSVMIDASVEHDRLSVEYFGQSGTQDSSSISVASFDESYIINAAFFSREISRLYDVTLIELDDDRGLEARISALYADWDEDAGCWVLHDGRQYLVNGDIVEPSFFDELSMDNVTLEPEYFTNQSRDITTMGFSAAMTYLKNVRILDKDAWYASMTSFISRLSSPFAILILVLISLLMNYRFKKNVFLFSLIQSLCTAVVYYVVQMLVGIMCSQAMLEPVFSAIIPAASVLIISLLIRLTGIRNA